MASQLLFAIKERCAERRVVLSQEVSTKYGKVVGRRILPGVDAFQGIPYAKPPVGELRFKRPQPPDRWEGVLRVTKFARRPIQRDIFFTDTLHYGPCSEDCLYLNVFAPTVTDNESKTSLRPVMVFIHGGGYIVDSAAKYGDIGIAEALVKPHGVIVVSIEYRLGLLGFFTTGDDACEDNIALWDMTMALEWVQENIFQFGGDKANVTLFGQSAGGSSVDLLSLSPHSRDLFRNIITMAGCSHSDWAMDTTAVSKCRMFADDVGVLTRDSQEVIEKLRELPAHKFALGLDLNIDGNVTKLSTKIGPRLDGKFFPKSLAELRAEAPVKPRMAGVCENEGLLGYYFSRNKTLTRIDEILALKISEPQYPNFLELRREALDLYFPPKGCISRESVSVPICKLFSDIFVSTSIQQSIMDQVKLGNKSAYLYSFDYVNPSSLGILPCRRLPVKEATHCTELAYLFNKAVNLPYRFNADDRKMLDIMTLLWTNFAKHGDPNIGNGALPKWAPATTDNPSNYFSIKLSPHMQSNFQEGRPMFWAQI